MSVQLYLWRITPQKLRQMQEEGVGIILDNEEEIALRIEQGLLLKKPIFQFMSHWSSERPMHKTLWQAAGGGKLFDDSVDRDDCPLFFSPDEVARLVEDLEHISERELKACFDAVRDIFGTLYMMDKTGTESKMTGDEAFEYLKNRFKEVVYYYYEAAQNGEAMLLLTY